MIQRYLCLPVLLTAVFCMGAPVRAQQGSPPQHAQNQRALSTPDSASRSVVAGGTPSVQEVEVRRVRISKTDRCQVIMELGGRVHYQAVRLSDPDRIYFDIEHARLSNELLDQPIDVPSGSCLKAVRVAQNRADVVRVVLDVAQVKDYSVSELADPDRLVVDLYGAANSTAAAANSATETSAKTVEVSRLRVSNANNCAQVIMDLGGRVQYQAARLSDPDRVYFDIKHARLSNELLRQPIDVPSGRCLKAVRVAQNRADVVRVVLDVAQLKDYSVSELAVPDRLVVDVYGSADNTAANAAPETGAKTTALAPGSSAPEVRGEASAPKTAPSETAPSPATAEASAPKTAPSETAPSPATGEASTPKTAPSETAPSPATGEASAPKTAPSETAPSPATGEASAPKTAPSETAPSPATGEASTPKTAPSETAPSPATAEASTPKTAPSETAPSPATGEASTPKTAPSETAPGPAIAPLPPSVKAPPSPSPMPTSLGVATATAVGQSPSPKTTADRQDPRPASKLTVASSPQDTGAVRGNVHDPDGTAVPDTNVDLTNSSGGQRLSTTTDEDGVFEFTKVPPGNYALHVIIPGFEPVEKPVVVGSEPLARIRVKLKIAQVSEKVTVSGQSVVVAEENRSQARFDEHMVMNMPVRDADPLVVPSLFLNPAVVGSSGPTLIVDGVETSSLDLPTSSVKSVTVDQNPYSPEFGRPGKGRLEITTRKGVHSRYRGNVLAMFRNSALDARNALAVERPVQQRGIGEVELDGPLTGSGLTTFFVAGRYHLFNNSAVVDATTPPGLVVNNITTPGGSLIENVAVPERTTSLFGRVDSHFRPTHTLSLFYKYKDSKLDNQGVGGLDLPDRGTNFFEHENEFRAVETATPSANFQNQARFTYKQDRQSTTSVSNDPAVIVLGAFNSGGAQTDRHLTETMADAQDVASLFYGRHNLRFGTGVKLRYFSAEDRSNFGGTFTFSSLADFQSTPSPQPSQFNMNFGNPSVDFQDHQVFAFLQDQLRLLPNLSVMAGLRYEFQPAVSHYQNLAPRLAVAYSPGGTNRILSNTVFRGGFGIFYDRQPYLMQQDGLLYDGSAIRGIVLSCPLSCPSYPNAFLPGNPPAAVATPSIRTTDPNIRFPYLMQGSLAIERKLWRGQNYLTLELSTVRGLDLYRSRNINAPLPGTISPPNPNFVNIDQFEASGSSRSNSLSIAYKGDVHKLNIMLQYVLSRTLDDVNDVKNGFLYTPANNYNPHGDWGRSDLDRRHRFNAVFLYPLRFGFHVSGIVNVWSGLPYNITTGKDDNYDTVFNDRPLGLWRNAGRAAGYTDVDLRLTKRWRVTHSEHAHFVEAAVDVFNIFNHTNFGSYNGVLSSPTFGQPYTANSARQLQVSVRYHF